MKKAMQIFAIVVIAMYFIFVGVLVYEFVKMWDDHGCWVIQHNGETNKECEAKYGFE
jgi:hypothetical protein